MDSTDHLDTWQEAGKKKKQSKSTEPKENDNKEQNVSENEKKNSSEPTVEREKRENGTSRYTRGSNNPRGRNRGTYKSVKSGKDDAKTMEHDTKDVTEQHSKEKEPTDENNQNVSVHSSRGRVMRGRGNGRFFRGGRGRRGGRFENGLVRDPEDNGTELGDPSSDHQNEGTWNTGKPKKRQPTPRAPTFIPSTEAVEKIANWDDIDPFCPEKEATDLEDEEYTGSLAETKVFTNSSKKLQ